MTAPDVALAPDLWNDPATLAIRVVDHEPAPQGSFSAVIRGKRAVLFSDNTKTAPWRAAVVKAAHSAIEASSWLPIVDGAVEVGVMFYLARPASVRRAMPFVRPDVDKLARSTLDALTTAQVLSDDATVTDLTVRKRYADNGRPPGAIVLVRPVVLGLF